MVSILAVVIGMIAARWLSWFSLIAVSIILAVALGIEGVVHHRSYLEVLLRGFEFNAILQGAYLLQIFLQDYGPRLLRRSDRR